MLKNILLLVALIVSYKSFSADKTAEFEKILFNRDNIEISGLFYDGTNLLFVADKLSNRAIYKIQFEKDRFYYKNHIDLSKLKNHDIYFAKALIFKHGGRLVKSPFDLEGLTKCNSTYYLVNEQVRHILKIENNTLDILPIDFKPIFKKNDYPLEKISTNAGFEGITIDCKKNILYIAQERDPRAIIQVDLKTNSVTNMFLLDNSKNKNGSKDFTDLYFENDFLYILERNEYNIIKYDLKKKKIVSNLSFEKIKSGSARDLYSTGEPYGLAEGLAMSNDTIYISIDNNYHPLSKKSEKEFNLKGNFSSVLVFKRPSGF